LPISYKIAHSQPVLAIRFNPETKQQSLETLQWGLVPYWSKDGKTGFINARAERIEIAPAFRRPFQKCRGWQNPDTKEWLRTCVIITGEANELVAQIHNRMPVILPPETHDQWLSGEPEKKSCVRFLPRKRPQDGLPTD
jgi:putative SOS response-associated peptidase YedK